ncbi:MAG: Alpha-galactosidase [Bacteroidota bacterium]|nr:Alpha-galactosidase [Bacteroidota bacterium]
MQFKSFYLKYVAHEQSEEIVSQNFSVFENDHLRIEFLLEDLSGDKIYKVHITPKTEIEFIDFYIETFFDYSESRGVFCNGFQSWTETKIFDKTDKIPGQRKFIKKIAEAYGDGLFYDYKNKTGVVHSWTYTYIKQPKRRVQFFGSLSDKTGYTVFEHHAKENKMLIKKDCKGFITSENVELLNIFSSLSHEKICFDNYFEAQQLTPVKVKPAIGWTSWYYYYTKISEKIIEENLESFAKNNIPIEIFQIDDGYQKAVGDWLNFNERFPNGLKNIVEKIHRHNIKAGLWLAPLTCEHNSFIVKDHPDWILKNDTGKFLKIGFNPLWSYWFYALDVYHPEVRAYLKKIFDTVLKDWNFDLVKLDFLYGVALIARNGKSRGQIMHDSMEFLRECVEEKMILGCGVPLIAANGTTDYCRIGPDVHMDWDFKLLKWIRARERPSTQNAIHNTISRRQLSGNWFLNDPDVFVLRKNKNSLSFEEKYSLLLANLLFGHLLFTSDNIGEYDAETLLLYKSIFPLMQASDVDVSYKNDFYTIRFRINERNFLALINTSDTSRMYKLPDNLFFDNVKEDFIKGGKMIEIPGHASKCYLAVGYMPFAIAGSKGHFFAGTEIESIYLSGNKIELEWTPGILNDVKVYIKVPVEYDVESINKSGNFIRTEKKDFSIIEVEKRKL